MNVEILLGFLCSRYGKIFYRHAALIFFLRPPSPPAGRSASCKQNHNQSKPFAKGGFAALVTQLHGRTPLSRTRSEVKPVPWLRQAAVPHTTNTEEIGIWKINTAAWIISARKNPRNYGFQTRLTSTWRTEPSTMFAASLPETWWWAICWMPWRWKSWKGCSESRKTSASSFSTVMRPSARPSRSAAGNWRSSLPPAGRTSNP